MAIGRPISLTPNIATKAINSVATANQTDFTVTGGYRINELAVYRNGVRLAQGRDFTANDGTTVTLTNGATVNDVIEFVVFDSFNVADAIVSVASSQTVSGDLNVTGKFYSGSIDPNSLNAGVGTITRISNTSLVATSATVSSSFHVGSALTANAAGDVESIGIITAASFSGDGSSLTNVSGIVTSNIVSVAITTKDINVSAAATITGALTGSTGTFSGAVNVDATTDSTSSSTGALIVDGGLGVAKNVYIGAGLSVAGTLTYEDVTNVDSVGLITAKSGVNVTGGQLQVGVAYSVGAAGVATALGFVAGTSGFTGAVDLNGGVLTLDADADTTITADTDDQIDIAFGGNDRITLSTGLIDLKNDGSQSAVRFYCESSNAHYTALQAAAHSAYSGNATVTLPASTDTLIGRTTTDTLTNKTLSAPSITGDVDIADKIVHTGDTNTALRFPSADTFTVETGGSERLRITSGGLVGINTDSPTARLEIVESKVKTWTPTSQTELIVERNGNCLVSIVGGNSSNTSLNFGDADDENVGNIDYDHADNSMSFRTNASEALRITSSGRVGIDTAIPRCALDLGDNNHTDGASLSNTPADYQLGVHAAQSTTGDIARNIGFIALSANKVTAAINSVDDGTNDTSGLLFATGNGSGLSERLKVTGGGDVEFYGTAAGVSSVTWDASANSLIFNDNSHAKFGDGSDLSLWHDGTNSHIKNSTNGLYSWSSGNHYFVDGDNSSHNRAVFINSGAVELYYDAVKKFDTTTQGISVTGNIGLSAELDFTGPAHKYIDFYTKASDNTLYNATIRLVNHDSSDFDNAINMEREGRVQLYHAGNQKFETTNDGVNITGIATVSQGLNTDGLLSEKFNTTAGKLSDNTNIDLEDGMVHYFSTQETTTSTPNIRYSSSKSLNNMLSTGDAISITVITTAAAGGYSANWTIDGSAVTEEWVGGSAPSAGGSDGLDIYGITILKTGSGAYKFIGNLTNAT